MKCRTARQLISSFVDATLDEGREQAFVSHVQRCDGCRQLLDEARLAREALHGFIAEDMAVPEDLSARIKGAIRQAEEDTTIIETSSTPAIGSPAFIATCASLFIGAVMFYVVTTEVYMERLDAQERSTSIAADMTRLRSGTQSRLAHATANDPGLALLAAPVGTDKDGSAPEVETDPAAAPDMFQSLTVRTPTTGLSTPGKTATSPTVRHKHVRTKAPADAARPVANAASARKKSPARIAGGTGAAAATGGEKTAVRRASIVDAKVSTPPGAEPGEEPQDAFLSLYKDISETQAGSPLRVGAAGYFVCKPGWEADSESCVPEHAAPPAEPPSRCGAAPE